MVSGLGMDLFRSSYLVVQFLVCTTYLSVDSVKVQIWLTQYKGAVIDDDVYPNPVLDN